MTLGVEMWVFGQKRELAKSKKDVPFWCKITLNKHLTSANYLIVIKM